MISATVAGVDLDEIGGTLKLDEGWSPYGQATLTVAVPDIAPLDPRIGQPRVLLTLTEDGYTRTADLGIRERSIAPDLTVTIDLATDEALLQDYKLVATVPYTPTTTSIRGLVSYVLSLIGASLTTTGPDAVIDPDKALWQPGVEAWDYLQPFLQTANLRLWCDETRTWRLTRSPSTSPGQIILSHLGDTLTDYGDTVSRDRGWYDAVVVVYKWTVSGFLQTAYDVASVPGYSKVITETHEDTPYPGPGAAANLLKRARGRGRELPAHAINDYRATPGMSARIIIPDTPAQTGWITAVDWDFDSNEMDISTRELIDTPATAWVLDAPGVSWLDVPAGIGWAEDE